MFNPIKMPKCECGSTLTSISEVFYVGQCVECENDYWRDSSEWEDSMREEADYHNNRYSEDGFIHGPGAYLSPPEIEPVHGMTGEYQTPTTEDLPF